MTKYDFYFNRITICFVESRQQEGKERNKTDEVIAMIQAREAEACPSFVVRDRVRSGWNQGSLVDLTRGLRKEFKAGFKFFI